MDLFARLEQFLAPFYQELDGSSRAGEVRRIAAIARRMHPELSRELELLLRFHLLGPWLERLGNLSRLRLAVRGLAESELRATAQSIRRLDAPATAVERTVAAARIIDGAGLRGLAESIARARREGATLAEIAAAGARPAPVPEWFPEAGLPMLREREERRVAFCRELLEEIE